MKRIATSLILLAALAIAGCASIENSGYREVKVTHAAGGCDLTSKDGKEQKRLIEKFDGKNCTYETTAEDVKAVKSQALAVKALTVLPVTGLGDILAPRDK